MPKAFIVYGHDDVAYEELCTFLENLSFNVDPFLVVAADKPNVDTSLGIVEHGIDSADVVIVLFTPDEQANWHDPKTGEFRAFKRGEKEPLAGWQPRPNVVFEAGIAVAKARNKMI